MSEETRLANIMKSREAVRLHTECSMPERQTAWEIELKRRAEKQNSLPKPKPKPLPAKPVLTDSLGITVNIPETRPRDVSRELRGNPKSKVAAKKEIKSLLFRDDFKME